MNPRDELDILRVEHERLWAALYRIADMPVDPHPDGSFNYCRRALIDIARQALWPAR